MPIVWNDQQEIVDLDGQHWRGLLEKVLDLCECQKEVSVVLVDDRTMSELHNQFLGDPSPTDVLSFPLSDGPEDPFLGEVVVSVEMAQREAEERGHSWEAELALYVIHGILHLLGYDDKDEQRRQEMVRRQNELLGELGFPPISE